MRSEVGNDLSAGYEFVADSFKTVRIHDGRHDLAIDGERDIDGVVLDQCRPMLISHRVAQLDACAHCHFGHQARQSVQMHDHHVTQLDSRDDCRERLGVPEQDVSIADMGAAVD